MTFDEAYKAFEAHGERVSQIAGDLARARSEEKELTNRLARLERSLASAQSELACAAHALKPELEKAVSSRLGRSFRFEDDQGVAAGRS